MLLTIHDSFEAWRVLRWYGFWIIFGGLAFFYAGGRKALQSFHSKPAGTTKREKPQLHTEMPAVGALPGSSKGSPMTSAFVPPFDSAAQEVEKRLRESK
jgi:lysophospholipid acyltransferase